MFKHLGAPCELPTLKEKTTSKGRTYETESGNIYPSITTMLGKKEKPHLKEWRNMLGDKKADKEMKRCADRGTAVHELIEKYLNNEQDFTRGYKPEYIKGFNQLKLKLNKVDNIRMQEAALYSDQLRIAGRVDCIGTFQNKLAVIDFKTSNNVKQKEHIFDYFLQCTFYALAWFELTGEPIENIVILMTVEKGMVPLVFEDKIDNYIAPLLKRIDEYYKDHDGK